MFIWISICRFIFISLHLDLLLLFLSILVSLLLWEIKSLVSFQWVQVKTGLVMTP